jgi:hypothetical protein
LCTPGSMGRIGGDVGSGLKRQDAASTNKSCAKKNRMVDAASSRITGDIHAPWTRWPGIRKSPYPLNPYCR